MDQPELVVISETLSLAAALKELLEAAGFQKVLVHDPRRMGGLIVARETARAPILVAASNTYDSSSVRSWKMGMFPATHLVVVGSRDPQLRSEGKLHVVRLPLVPRDFLNLIRRLLGQKGPAVGKHRRLRQEPRIRRNPTATR